MKNNKSNSTNKNKKRIPDEKTVANVFAAKTGIKSPFDKTPKKKDAKPQKKHPDRERVDAIFSKRRPDILPPPDFDFEKINKKTLDKAYSLLRSYKSGKANLEKRITENDLWWKMRHFEQIRDRERKYNPASAWLFNAIASKHADVMDNIPESIVLPREKTDSDAAKQLSEILPVILEQNNFEETYSDVWYDKLKGGTGVYGVFWDSSLSNGAGDIAVKRCDVLNLFWEPGICDIQKSKNVFYVELYDNGELMEKYPELRGKLGGSSVEIAKYQYDDAVDTSNKTAVIDWYYKTEKNGKTILHFCKFCADEVLYASENDSLLYERGFYDHGQYPFIFDRLFVEQGTPCGFGYIDVMKDTQTQIDLISASVAENIRMASTVRYFARGDGSINEKEFADWSNPIVHYTGSGNPNDSMIPIRVPELPGVYMSFINSKIDELKETTGNNDFTRGNANSGVTAASAIAALQEAGSKMSRDMIKGAYRAFVKINTMMIELVRQFYSVPRCFRITGDGGQYEFVSYSNETILPTAQGNVYGVDLGTRLPVFDIKVKVQRQTVFSKLSQNELAKELYRLGFFNPQMSEQALTCLEMMEFDGKPIVIDRVTENNSILSKMNEMKSKLVELAAVVEKDHPELRGITDEIITSYSVGAEQKNGRLKAKSIPKSVPNTDRARERASLSASPR